MSSGWKGQSINALSSSVQPGMQSELDIRRSLQFDVSDIEDLEAGWSESSPDEVGNRDEVDRDEVRNRDGDNKNSDQRQRATNLLDMIRRSSLIHSKIHKRNYTCLKRALAGYQAVIVLLNTANAFLSSTGKPYMGQAALSVTNTVISSVCAVLTSMVIFLNFQKNMDADLASHKQYYALAVDVLGALANKSSTDDIVLVASQKCREYLQIKNDSNIVDDSEDDVISSLSRSSVTETISSKSRSRSRSSKSSKSSRLTLSRRMKPLPRRGNIRRVHPRHFFRRHESPM